MKIETNEKRCGVSRRNFLKRSLAATLGLGMASGLGTRACSNVFHANDDIRVAVVGMRSQGAYHIQKFRELDGVRVVALCDVDQNILNREVKKFTDRNEKVDAYIDVRKLLEEKHIDAVVIATPNHWHSLIAIWACQAGKDVYVEKPVSHNIWEGRKLVEAAKKYNRIVQVGTQSRSDEGLAEAIQYLQQGNIGKILVARGLCYKRRGSIGRVDGPQPIPPEVDYNLWTGPAPLVPLRRKQLHYDWHWVWPTGCGDIGNQGIHEMDICRWTLGQAGLPPRGMSIGGRFGYVDDGDTPNSQIAILDYEPAPIIFEVRGLPRTRDEAVVEFDQTTYTGGDTGAEKGAAVMDAYRGIRIGVVIQCEHGYFAGGGGGGWVYDNAGQKIKQFVGDGGIGHQANFIKAVRSRKVSDLNANILEGHISSALCHIANISHRIGQRSSPDEIREAIQAENAATDTFERFQEHLSANQIDLSKSRAVLGPWLTMDPEEKKFVGTDKFETTFWANVLLTRDYREPFVVPETI